MLILSVSLAAVDVMCCACTAQVTRDADGAMLLSGDWHGITGAALCGLLHGQPEFTLTMMDSFGDGACACCVHAVLVAVC